MPNITLQSIASRQRVLLSVNLTLLQKIGLFLLVSIIFAGLIFGLRSVLTNVGPWGYPLAFVISWLGAATILIPSPAFAIVVLMAQDSNPIALGVVSGIGGTFGELSGYWLGTQCGLWLKRCGVDGFFNRHMKRFGGGLLFVSALFPFIPVDAAGLVAGSIRYPIRKFLLYVGAGKIISNALFLYLSVEAFDRYEPYLKWVT